MKAKAALAASHAQEARHREKATTFRAAREAADRAQVEADANALLDGNAPLAGEGDPGAQHERVGAAHDAAADRLAAQRPALEAALREAEARLSDATLAAYIAQRDEAKGAALEAVEALAGPLAALLAAERVREALLPQPFSFDPARHPPASLWSASHAVHALLDGLPTRLRPEGFAARVAAEANRLAADTLERTGGKHG